MMMEVHNFEGAKAFIAKGGTVIQIEERVKLWIKKLKDFMAESKQIKRENDNSGPQEELEYWKRRGAQFNQVVNHLQVCGLFIFMFIQDPEFFIQAVNLQDHEVTMSLLCLQVARSKVIKDWVDTEGEVTYCYNEAKDNAKFIQALEKCCHCLYLDDPVRHLRNKTYKSMI